MSIRKPYQERNDLERLQSQWRKLSGLHSREEWSGAIVRAATAAEIAANFVIRKEFGARSQLDAAFVDHLLKWANGLSGKIDRLLLPLFVGKKEHAQLTKLRKVADSINNARNGIVHRGEFCNEEEAKAVIEKSKHFAETLVRIHEPDFAFKDRKG